MSGTIEGKPKVSPSIFPWPKQRTTAQQIRYTTNADQPAPRRRAARPLVIARRTRRSGVSRDATVPRVPIWRHQGLALTWTSVFAPGKGSSMKRGRWFLTDAMNGSSHLYTLLKQSGIHSFWVALEITLFWSWIHYKIIVESNSQIVVTDNHSFESGFHYFEMGFPLQNLVIPYVTVCRPTSKIFLSCTFREKNFSTFTRFAI